MEQPDSKSAKPLYKQLEASSKKLFCVANINLDSRSQLKMS
jgi:hypothetical protein